MVDWRPVMGIVPPMGDLEWQQEFDKYKNFPQFQKVNVDMTLEEFRSIFYWEYGHRVLGRLIGIMFFLPFVVFLLMGRIPRPLQPKLWFALFLGGLQGLMGWYMVKSGLIDEPRVSHFRLAAHLVLALLILAYLSWLVLGLLEVKPVPCSTGLRRLGWTFAALLGVQIVYGAFVAGNRAGYGFNTFPMMNGEWLPDLALQMQPFWHNLVDNNAMLQFIHRWVGASVLLLAGVLFWQARAVANRQLTLTTFVLLVAVIAQFLLGVMTLLHVVPIGLASLHQAGACVLVVATIVMLYSTKAEPARAVDPSS